VASRHLPRRIISWVLVVLAAIVIPVATVSVWATRTVLNTERFVAVVRPAVQDARVINALSTRLTDELSTVVSNSGVLNNIPDALKPVTTLLGGAIRSRVQARVEDVLSSDTAQQAIIGAVRTAHKAALRLLQGDGLLSSSALSVDNGKVTLNLIPVVRTVLLQLQADGVIPSSVQLPAPGDPPSRFGQALSERLGDDFGQIVVYDTGNPSSNTTLSDVQHLLVLTKRGVVLLVLLGLILAVAAVLVAVQRRRAIIHVALGVVIVGVLLTVVARRVAATVPNSVHSPGAKAAAADIADVLRTSLTRALIIVAAVAAIVAIVAWKQAFLRAWTTRHADIARIIAIALGVILLIVIGLGWWSLLAAALVVAGGLALVSYLERNRPTDEEPPPPSEPSPPAPTEASPAAPNEPSPAI
jgi:hypothetical protein